MKNPFFITKITLTFQSNNSFEKFPIFCLTVYSIAVLYSAKIPTNRRIFNIVNNRRPLPSRHVVVEELKRLCHEIFNLFFMRRKAICAHTIHLKFDFEFAGMLMIFEKHATIQTCC
jgi:hypothetical protein